MHLESERESFCRYTSSDSVVVVVEIRVEKWVMRVRRTWVLERDQSNSVILSFLTRPSTPKFFNINQREQ